MLDTSDEPGAPGPDPGVSGTGFARPGFLGFSGFFWVHFFEKNWVFGFSQVKIRFDKFFNYNFEVLMFFWKPKHLSIAIFGS